MELQSNGNEMLLITQMKMHNMAKGMTSDQAEKEANAEYERAKKRMKEAEASAPEVDRGNYG